MPLSSLNAAGLRAARAAMAEALREDGLESDFSVRSLYGLEQVVGRYRRLLEADPTALAPEVLVRLELRAAAYLAEVLQRAVPGTDISLEGGEMLVTVTGGLIPGMTWKVLPLARVKRLFREADGEGTLVALVAFTDVMAQPWPSGSLNPVDRAGGGGSEQG